MTKWHKPKMKNLPDWSIYRNVKGVSDHWSGISVNGEYGTCLEEHYRQETWCEIGIKHMELCCEYETVLPLERHHNKCKASQFDARYFSKLCSLEKGNCWVAKRLRAHWSLNMVVLICGIAGWTYFKLSSGNIQCPVERRFDDKEIFSKFAWGDSERVKIVLEWEFIHKLM